MNDFSVHSSVSCYRTRALRGLFNVNTITELNRVRECAGPADWQGLVWNCLDRRFTYMRGPGDSGKEFPNTASSRHKESQLDARRIDPITATVAMGFACV